MAALRSLVTCKSDGDVLKQKASNSTSLVGLHSDQEGHENADRAKHQPLEM